MSKLRKKNPEQRELTNTKTLHNELSRIIDTQKNTESLKHIYGILDGLKKQNLEKIPFSQIKIIDFRNKIIEENLTKEKIVDLFNETLKRARISLNTFTGMAVSYYSDLIGISLPPPEVKIDQNSRLLDAWGV
jgi:hypothetical protein